MRKNMKSRIVFNLVLLAAVCCPVILFAQPGFSTNVPDGAPIDGGLSLLAVAGVMYGSKKIFKPKQQEENGENNI